MMATRIAYLAQNTFRESVRSKILYSILFISVAIVLVTTLFGSVTIGDQAILVKDFGLFSVSIVSVAYAVISGATLLHKELSRRTIYTILARPVTRLEFLLGKYFGMLATALLIVLLMGVALLLYASLFEGKIAWSLSSAFLFIAYELIIVCAAAIFFSSIVVTPVLSGLFTFGIFLVGRSAGYLLYFIERGELDGLLAHTLSAIYHLVPHLNEFALFDSIVYGHTPDLAYSLWSFLYACGYAGVLLLLGSICFQRREFNL